MINVSYALTTRPRRHSFNTRDCNSLIVLPRAMLLSFHIGFSVANTTVVCVIPTITDIRGSDIAHTLDRRKQADLLMFDFSKDFDKVPHRRLAHKLDWYGVRNKSLAWITAFLKDRTQQVLLDGDTSTPRPITSGVPQGTVLGPVLFLAYINDLHESITNSNVRLFAEDCVLYRDITDRNDTDLLQQDIDALGRWEAKWLMEFNVDKCFVMHATHSKHKIQHQYTLHKQTLTHVKHSKYLGVTLSDDLTWRTHIQRSR